VVTRGARGEYLFSRYGDLWNWEMALSEPRARKWMTGYEPVERFETWRPTSPLAAPPYTVGGSARFR
jgi:hypothetical protein